MLAEIVKVPLCGSRQPETQDRLDSGVVVCDNGYRHPHRCCTWIILKWHLDLRMWNEESGNILSYRQNKVKATTCISKSILAKGCLG